MGLSSSQARLLSLTGRMHDIEYKAQKLEAQKLQMANESRRAYEEYENALEASIIQLKQIGTDGQDYFINATYNNMIDNDYRIGFAEKVKVTQATADNYQIANGNKDYFVYLQTGVSGAPAGYTAIYTADQLQNLDMNGKYMLMGDIDMSGVNWTGIGSANSPFTGTFDGNGHVISNLEVNSAGDYAGFFNRVEGATITNVVMANSNVTATDRYVGSLIGYSKNSTITNCSSYGAIVNGGKGVGGLIGYGNNITVDNCSVTGSVTSQTSYNGGFIGYLWNGNVTNCTSSTNVRAISCVESTSDTGNGIGGFVGVAGGTSTIDGCSASGSVAGHREVGGFIGSLAATSTITNSSANANTVAVPLENITSNDHDSYNYGGFAGYNNGTIDNCTASGTITGPCNVGGFVGRQTAGTISDCYTDTKITKTELYFVDGGLVSTGGVGAFSGNNLAPVTNSNFGTGTGYTNAAGSNSSTINATASTVAPAGVGQPTPTTVTRPTITYKNTSPDAQEAEELFDSIQESGYEVETGVIENPQDGHEDDSIWFTNMVNAGHLFIYKKDDEGNYYQTSVATDTELKEVDDKTNLRKAEAEYEANMLKIDRKDRKYDQDLAALDAERNAIKQEIETLKTVAKENVERTFKLFS